MLAHVGWKAVLWTCICPGLGEYRLGHRALGAAIMVAFLSACGWLLVGSYRAVNEISEYVKSHDPALSMPAESPAEVASQVTRLASAIKAEYDRRSADVHRRVAIPLWILFILYVYSVVQSFVLGTRQDRAGP